MMVYPQHAVVSFNLNWSVKEWHCIVCGETEISQDLFASHLETHVLNQLSATVVATGISEENDFVNKTTVFSTNASSKDVNASSVRTSNKTTSVELLKLEVEKCESLCDDARISTGIGSLEIKQEPNDMQNDEAGRSYQYEETPMEEDTSSVENGDEDADANYDPMEEDNLSEVTNHSVEQSQVPQTSNYINKNDLYKKIVEATENSSHALAIREKGVLDDNTCGFCERKFRGRQKLVRHVDALHARLRYPCLLCDKKFSSREWIRYHLKEHFQDESYDCKTCGRTFSKKSLLLSHQQESNACGENDSKQRDKTTVRSPKQVSYSEYYTKETEVVEKTPESEQRNRTAGRSLRTPKRVSYSGLDAEETEAVKRTPRQKSSQVFDGLHHCKLCSEFYETKHALGLHVQEMHPETLKYLCNVCNKRFAQSSNYLKHRRTHGIVEHSSRNSIVTNDRQSVSTDANDSLENSEFERSNTSFSFKNDNEFYACKECSEKFESKYLLGKHMKDSHPDTMKYHCSDCNQSFIQSSNYNKHRRKHHGLDESLEIRCRICSEVCETKRALGIHIQEFHPETLKYYCDVCERRFSQSSNYLKHRRTHGIDEKSSRHGNLLNMIVAENDSSLNEKAQPVLNAYQRNFSCKFCDGKFFNKVELGLHIKEDHKDNLKYKCNMCDQAFLESANFLKHIKRVHGVDQPSQEDEQFQNTYDKLNDKDSTLCGFTEEESYSVNNLNGSFSCKFCSHECEDKTLIIQHVKENHGEKLKFHCEICNETFNESSTYYKHREIHEVAADNVKKFSCSVCDQVFIELMLLKRHMARVHCVGDIFPCQLCGQEYIEENDLKNHTLIHEGEFQFQCVECTKGFTNEGSYRKHLLGHTNIYCCHKCDIIYKSAEDLKKHVEEYHGGLNPCHLCTKLFKGYVNLKYHVNNHFRLRENTGFTCKICDRKFRFKSNMDKHKKTHNAVRDTHLCPHCGKHFLQHTNLNRHIHVVHSGVKYPCKFCKKEFNCPSILKYHTMMHEGNFRFQCSECGKGFVRKHQYDRHPCNFINKEPTIPCPLCDKKFHTKERLRDHHKVKHTEKRFHCDLCDAVFENKFRLNRHKESTVHLGIKYNCDLCDKSFTQKTHLRYHQNEHAGIYKYQCSTCGKGFSLLNNFRQHSQRCAGNFAKLSS